MHIIHKKCQSEAPKDKIMAICPVLVTLERKKVEKFSFSSKILSPRKKAGEIITSYIYEKGIYSAKKATHKLIYIPN